MRRADLLGAAALADPADVTPAGQIAGEVSPAAVVSILRDNKVPLVDLGEATRVAPELRRVVESAAWLEALERERRERDDLAGELAEITAGFDRRGITAVLFKTSGGVPYRSSNVDLLVRPARMSEAAAILAELGHVRFPHYREDHKLLFRRFRFGRSVICTHLHDAVSWGKILILPGDDVVARCREPRAGAVAAGCRVSSPEDLVLTTLAHSLYETDEVRLSDLRAVRQSVTTPGFDWERILSRVRRNGWTRGFFSILRIAAALETALWGASAVPSELLQGPARAELAGTRWARRHVERTEDAVGRGPLAGLPHRIPKRYTKLHYLMRLIASPDRAGDERLADLFATAWNLLANRLRLRCRPAAIVSLSGLDGSGKSSVIQVLAETMTLCEIPIRVVWSRGGFTTWMAAAKRAARSAMPRSIPGPGDLEAKQRWLGRPLEAAAFASVVVAEQTLHYLLRVRARRWTGWSIVCDRFAYDTEADLEAKLGLRRRLARAAGAIVTDLAPRPDVAILLRLAPSEAARRKPEESPGEAAVRARAAAYDRIAALHGLVVVDADRSIAEVAADVVDLALRVSFSKFSGAGR
ncbi:MAG TPA: nucleotidyltransferase family protein [Candidatus Polarisedimenticolia bacterium]|jgi:thymidylate kinase